MNKNYLRFILVVALALTSCEYTQTGSSGDRDPASQGNPDPTPTPTATPTPTPSPTATPTPKPTATPTPSSGTAKPLWEAKVADGSSWSAHVMNKLDTLGIDMLNNQPADYSTFCPAYNKFTYTQKKEFFTYLISAMAKYESAFNTNSFYKESFNDSSGNPVISRGLLQISIESGNAYGCGFRNEQELHDPYLNLSCGIRILNRWIGQRDFRIAGKVDGSWKGGARYWSVLRTTSGSYSSIVSLAKGTSLCSPTSL